MNKSDLPFGILRARRRMPPLNRRQRAVSAFRINIITIIVGTIIVAVMHLIAATTK